MLVSYTEPVKRLVNRAKRIGLDVQPLIDKGLLDIRYRSTVNAEGDDLVNEILELVRAKKATRVVVDGVGDINGVVDHDRVRTLLTAMIIELRNLGVTTLFVKEVAKFAGPNLDFSDTPISIVAKKNILSSAMSSSAADCIASSQSSRCARAADPYIPSCRSARPASGCSSRCATARVCCSASRAPSPSIWRMTMGAAKVLVTEASPHSFRDVLRARRLARLQCLAAADGDEAVVIARREQPNLVITDYMMPGRTGTECDLRRSATIRTSRPFPPS